MRICNRKDCPHSGKPQPEDNFPKCSRDPTARRPVCKTCVYEKKKRNNAKKGDWLKMWI